MVNFESLLIARRSVDKIVEDIRDRTTIRGAWDAYDEETQRIIKDKWVSIIYHWVNVANDERKANEPT